MEIQKLILILSLVVLAQSHLSHEHPNMEDHHYSHHHHQNQHSSPERIYAIAILYPDNNSGVSGVVRMMQEGEITRIQAKITGLDGYIEFNIMIDGFHGFHIHEFGNLLEGCISAGPHYNPHKVTHGGPGEDVRHIGDLGNIQSFKEVGIYDAMESVVRLSGELSVIGRSVVVHAMEDDLGREDNEESKKTGNAGARLACGVIGVSGPFDFLSFESESFELIL